ncbi:protein FAM217A isoform X2 [Lissotriton helveticus]
MENLHLSKHKHIQRHQNALLCSPPRSSHSWNNRPKQENGAMNRPFNSHMDANYAASLKIYMRNPAFSAVPMWQQPSVSPERSRMPSQFQWSFESTHSRNTNEKPTLHSCPAIECSDHQALLSAVWNQKMTMTESSLSDESGLSDNEKPDEVLLSYSKRLDTTLSPEVIDHVEESCSTSEAQCFTYADVLPPPLNTMELQELASPNSGAWKNGVDPSLEVTIRPLVVRLLQMEKMQHMTIHKERCKISQAHLSCSGHPWTSTRGAFNKPKQSKCDEPKCLPTTSADRTQQLKPKSTCHCKCKRKGSKCSCCNIKWSSRTACGRVLSTARYRTQGATNRISKPHWLSELNHLVLQLPSSHASSSMCPPSAQVT